MVLSPEEVRLGGGPAWRGRGSGSSGPRWQVHRGQTARGVRRSRAARGTGCPQREGRWPGRGTRARARAPGTEAGREPGSTTWPASLHLDAGSVGGAYPGARPPGLPASRHPAPHPPQALVPRLPPLPRLGSEPPSGRRRESRGGTGARTRRAEWAEGLRGWRAAGGGRAHSRAPCAPPAPGSLPAGKTAARPLGSHPPQPRPGPIRLALNDVPSRPQLGLIGRRGSGGALLGAGLPARGAARRSQDPAGVPAAQPPAAGA